MTMSQIQKGIFVFGALAIALTGGAVQFASGHDLVGGQNVAARNISASVSETVVNRAAKADRGAVVPSAIRFETIALKLDSLAETSVVIRVPVVRQEARSRPVAPRLLKSDPRRMTVACEPVVSVLTEVAKRLEPGRCVT